MGVFLSLNSVWKRFTKDLGLGYLFGVAAIGFSSE